MNCLCKGNPEACTNRNALLISLLLLIISNIIPLSYPKAIIQEISLSCPKGNLLQGLPLTSFKAIYLMKIPLIHLKDNLS